MDMITRLCEGLASRLRIVFYRTLGVRIRGHVSLRRVEIPRRPHCITLEPGAALDRGVTLLATHDDARIVIGAGVYINRHTMLDANELIEIGAGAMVGPFCYLTDHDHTTALNNHDFPTERARRDSLRPYCSSNRRHTALYLQFERRCVPTQQHVHWACRR